MSSVLVLKSGAALLIYSAEKLIVYLVGAASGLKISLFLLAVIFTGIEFDDIVLREDQGMQMRCGLAPCFARDAHD